jgi:hypothetical protein
MTRLRCDRGSVERAGRGPLARTRALRSLPCSRRGWRVSRMLSRTLSMRRRLRSARP